MFHIHCQHQKQKKSNKPIVFPFNICPLEVWWLLSILPKLLFREPYDFKTAKSCNVTRVIDGLWMKWAAVEQSFIVQIESWVTILGFTKVVQNLIRQPDNPLSLQPLICVPCTLSFLQLLDTVSPTLNNNNFEMKRDLFVSCKKRTFVGNCLIS